MVGGAAKQRRHSQGKGTIVKHIGTAALCLLLGACGAVAPKYSASAENQLELRNASLPHARVADIIAASPSINQVSLRGGKFASPSVTFNGYLGDAIRTELAQAGLLDQAADVVIGGAMTRNDFDGSGFSTGTADLAADFWVDRKGDRVYQGKKTTHYEWQSSFAGMTAIPEAAQGYMDAVQKLIHELLADPQFQNAIKG